MFKRLLFVLLFPIVMLLSGFQLIILFIGAIVEWVIKGKQDIVTTKREILMEKAFKLIENNGNNK